MILLGGRQKSRLTEQHDIFFSIGSSLKSLVPEMQSFWPELGDRMHIDAWRTVTLVDGYSIEVSKDFKASSNELNLFFLNLGGYKPDLFEEPHYKMLAVDVSMSKAIARSKETAFYKHMGFEGAVSHVDDKFGIDIDDCFNVKDILTEEIKSKYNLIIKKADPNTIPDEIHLGYLPLKKLS